MDSDMTSSIRVNESVGNAVTMASSFDGIDYSMNSKICPEADGNSTDYFYATAQMVTGLFIYPAFCFPGLVGNILTVVVLSQRNMLTSTNAFLSALAVSDSIKLINDILYFFVTLFFNIDPVLGNLSYGYLYPYAHFIFSMSVCVSSWLTLSVAVERYILVCHPTRARSLWSRKRAVTLCIIIYVVMTSLALPSAFRYRTIRCFDRQLNATRLDVELTEMWQNEVFVTSYTWAQNLLRSIIPLVVLVALNICIIRAVRRTTKVRKRKNARHRVTVMMIVVILTFLVCITPDAILSTVFGRGYHEAGTVTKGIREITDTLLTINAAVNFIIYCALNKVFRKSFAHLCCRRKRPDGGWVTEMDESVYRRLSEAKTSILSNNNHPLTGQHDNITSPSGNQGNTNITPSSPKFLVDSADANNRNMYFSLSSDDPSSPVSPGFSSSGYTLLPNASTTKDTGASSAPNSSSSSSRKFARNQQSKSRHRYHQNNSTRHHIGSSHGLKKSRNSVKCNRGKRAVVGDKDIENDNIMNEKETVTYITTEDFESNVNNMRRGSGRRPLPLKTDSSNSKGEYCDSSKFVLDLSDNRKMNNSATVTTPHTNSCPSTPHSLNIDSPATTNSDVFNDEDLQSDAITSPNDDVTFTSLDLGNTVDTSCDAIPDVIPENERTGNDDVNDGNDEIGTDDSSTFISPLGENEPMKYDNANLNHDENSGSKGCNKVKRRPLTVSFSDC